MQLQLIFKNFFEQIYTSIFKSFKKKGHNTQCLQISHLKLSLSLICLTNFLSAFKKKKKVYFQTVQVDLKAHQMFKITYILYVLTSPFLTSFHTSPSTPITPSYSLIPLFIWTIFLYVQFFNFWKFFKCCQLKALSTFYLPGVTQIKHQFAHNTVVTKLMITPQFRCWEGETPLAH